MKNAKKLLQELAERWANGELDIQFSPKHIRELKGPWPHPNQIVLMQMIDRTPLITLQDCLDQCPKGTIKKILWDTRSYTLEEAATACKWHSKAQLKVYYK